MQHRGDVSEHPEVQINRPAEPDLASSPPAESAHRFENVCLVKNEQTGRGPVGVLIARGDSLEFQSKKGMLLMPTIRGVNFSNSAMSGVRLTIEYGGDGTPIQSANFADFSKGKFSRRGVKTATQELAQKLNQALNIREMSGQDRAVLDQAKRKRGAWQMAIGALLAVAGTIITIATYSDASSDSEGGTYIVAWGPIVFGIILFIQGVVQNRSSR
jgi:hypothetical protein